MFDDAVPNGDQTATSGTLPSAAPGSTWTGDIPVGGTVTVTGTVTINNPDTGNKVLTTRSPPPRRATTARPARTDPRLHASVPVLIPGLTITNTPNTNAPCPARPSATP